MDTDDLSEMAYGIIVHAAQVSDTLKMDYWNLEEEEGVTTSQIQEIAEYLYRRADETLARPFPKRNR